MATVCEQSMPLVCARAGAVHTAQAKSSPKAIGTVHRQWDELSDAGFMAVTPCVDVAKACAARADGTGRGTGTAPSARHAGASLSLASPGRETDGYLD